MTSARKIRTVQVLADSQDPTEIGDADFRSMDQLLQWAQRAHERALASHQEFLTEYSTIRASLSALEETQRKASNEVADSISPKRTVELVGEVQEDLTPRSTSKRSVELAEASAIAGLPINVRPYSPAGDSIATSRRALSVESLMAESSESQNVQQKNDLWLVWTKEVEDLGEDSRQVAAVSSARFALARPRAVWGERAGIGGAKRTFMQRFVILPNSKKKVTWDLASLLVLVYDMFMIPLSVFDLGMEGVFKWIELAITIFWTFDICVSFLSAFYKLGVVENKLREIARRYVQGSFSFDITIVLVDWLLTLSTFFESSFVSLMRLGKLIRFGKVFRMLRLVRVLRLPKVLKGITEAVKSKTFTTALGISKAIIFIAVMNHFVACIWYFISMSQREDYGEPAWVDKLVEEGRDDVYFYLTAMHWSVTQFTPASMEVQPRNSVERVYVIFIVFGALLVFSTFVSGITSAMTNLREYNIHRSNQLEAIDTYLIDKKVSVDLSSRISTFIQAYGFLSKRKVREQDIEVFGALPPDLKYQLRFESHGSFLIRCSFFYQLREFDRKGFIEVCANCITEMSVELGHELFMPRQDAVDMYFLLDGHVEYTQKEEVVRMSTEDGSFIFCEAALWIRYQHSGRLYCKTSSLFLALSSASFRGLVPSRATIYHCCRSYALTYMQALPRDKSQRGIDSAALDMGGIRFDEVQEIAQTTFERAYEQVLTPSSSYSFRRGSFRGGQLVHEKTPEGVPHMDLQAARTHE